MCYAHIAGSKYGAKINYYSICIEISALDSGKLFLRGAVHSFVKYIFGRRFVDVRSTLGFVAGSKTKTWYSIFFIHIFLEIKSTLGNILVGLHCFARFSFSLRLHIAIQDTTSSATHIDLF